MLHSDFFGMDMVYDDVAEGCDPIRDEDETILGWKRNIYSYPPIGCPDSGAYVTAGDLDRFLRQAKAGSLLSPQSTSVFVTPQVVHHTVDDWDQVDGHRLWFAVDRAGNVVFAEKEGVNASVNAVLRCYPTRMSTSSSSPTAKGTKRNHSRLSIGSSPRIRDIGRANHAAPARSQAPIAKVCQCRGSQPLGVLRHTSRFSGPHQAKPYRNNWCGLTDSNRWPIRVADEIASSGNRDRHGPHSH